MGLNFRKSIGLGKGFKMNISKSGVGFSAGSKGLRMSTSSKGTRLSVGYGGVRYTSKISGVKKRKRDESEMTVFDVFVGSLILFILSTFLKIKNINLFGVTSWFIGVSFFIGIISFFELRLRKKASNSDIVLEQEISDDIKENKFSTLENEILTKIKSNGTKGMLQTELIDSYFKGSPSKSTIYENIKKMELDNKIERIKSGRTYKIYIKYI